MIYQLDQFEEGRTNPITGENYDESWRIFVLNEAPYTIICGSTKGCAYTLKVSKLHAPWQFSLGDFVSYHTGAGRNIILAVSQKDYEEAMRMYGNSTCRDRFLRPHERSVMVHSTTMESYQNILKEIIQPNIEKRAIFPGNVMFSGFSLGLKNLSDTLKTHKKTTVTNM